MSALGAYIFSCIKLACKSIPHQIQTVLTASDNVVQHIRGRSVLYVKILYLVFSFDELSKLAVNITRCKTSVRELFAQRSAH